MQRYLILVVFIKNAVSILASIGSQNNSGTACSIGTLEASAVKRKERLTTFLLVVCI